MSYKKCKNCEYNKRMIDVNDQPGDMICTHPRVSEICKAIYPAGDGDCDCDIEKFDDGTLFMGMGK